MVEYSINLDKVFQSLSDPTRRDILSLVSTTSLSVGQLAHFYDLSFAAVSKHIKVLENSKLISKHRKGKKIFIRSRPRAMQEAYNFLLKFEKNWTENHHR